MALRSALMRTTAVITLLEALHVDVVERGLEVMRGLLEGHRLATIECRLVALEAVVARALVVAMEGLLELVDGELHAVPRGGADHGHPPDDCVSDEDIGRALGPPSARDRGDDRASAQDGE